MKTILNFILKSNANINFIFAFLFLQTITLFSQQIPDARIYFVYWDDIFNIPRDMQVDLMINKPPFKEISPWSGQKLNCVSFEVFSTSAAVKISAAEYPLVVDPWDLHPVTRPYKEIFIYSEATQTSITIPTQYCGRKLKVECIPVNLPQPDIFIPYNFSDINKHSENKHNLRPYVPGHKMLVLRKAYFWENAEDILFPYADIRLGICDTSILQYTYKELRLNPSVWADNKIKYYDAEIPGPIWFAEEGKAQYDRYDEWIDGPFGCVYSNIAVWDWDAHPSAIVPIVYEIDLREDLLGFYPTSINANTSNPILIKAGIYGWIILENIIAYDPEPCTLADVYWYGGWDGIFPEPVSGPINSVVTSGYGYGSQFRPFTDELFWKFHDEKMYDGLTVGLLGGVFSVPQGKNFDRPRIYKAVNEPVVFGR